MVNTSANIQGDLQNEGQTGENLLEIPKGCSNNGHITKTEYERVFNELAAFLYTQYRNKKQQEQIDKTIERGFSKGDYC